MAINSLLLQLSVIILLSQSITKTNAHTQCQQHEKAVLLELRNQLVFNSSYSRALVQWNQTGDCCRWEGVKCDGIGNVWSLHLHDEAISGGFNELSSLFGLNYLEELNLAANSFSGSLPDSFSNLERLTHLNLSNCKFNGSIPFTLSNLTQLVEVDLSHNLFSGSISSNHFEGLSKVESMDLSNNLLSGTIPTSIFTLPSLARLDLHDNHFGGQASEFSTINISHLSYLDLSSNLLESPIPDSFFHIKSLIHLDLSHNLFSDTFQLEKILTLPHLQHLDLSGNNLSLDATNTISNSKNFLVQQSFLNYLDLSNNKIVGDVPSWIWEIGDGSLTYLNLSCNMLVDLQKPYNIPASLCFHVLDLHSNMFQGKLPSLLQALYVDYSNSYFNNSLTYIETFSIHTLQFLSIANNSLSGPFPTSVCNYIHLQVLDLSVNNLSGSIPSCLFENLMDLRVLNLGGNNINGHIPDKFSPNCSLRTLDISDNNLVGDVPRSLGNCTSLVVMNMGNNHINDIFPCMLPSSLQLLVLRSNGFHGEIKCQNQSWPNLQIIDISSNNFSGYLNPFNFSSWRGMMLDTDAQGTIGVEPIRMSHSHISQVMAVNPQGLEKSNYREEVMLTIKGVELKLVKINSKFTFIDFSYNNFHGYIPEEFGELKSLCLLNLSHNSLTGAIPKSLSKLSALESLDLSMNQLTGEIPEEIVGLTFLEMMNVSHNKLVGEIPVGTQIQSFPDACFEGNTGLCGPPLNTSCMSRGAITGLLPSHMEIEWVYVFVAAGYVVGLGSFCWVLLLCQSFREKYFEKLEDVFDMILLPKKEEKKISDIGFQFCNRRK